MGKKSYRYCARAVKGKGWIVWDRKFGKSWGKPSKDFPGRILDLLNSGRRSEIRY